MRRLLLQLVLTRKDDETTVKASLFISAGGLNSVAKGVVPERTRGLQVSGFFYKLMISGG